MNIGRINRLKVKKLVDFGAYLDGGNEEEILLPAKFIKEELKPEDEIDVFVYTDSEDRLIATTRKPRAMVGEFAYMEVVQVNKVGAFLDWGVEAKDLLVPFREQKTEMREGGIYLVYIYLDHATQRIVGSAKINKFLGNVIPHYKKGDEVEALVYEQTPIGFRCIVDNLHHGMIYANETYADVRVGDKVKAYVKNVREDMKIDLMTGDRADRRTNNLSDTILEELKENGGKLPYSDKSSPEEIQKRFGCSKRDFKKAIGHLYKAHKIDIGQDGIALATDKK